MRWNVLRANGLGILLSVQDISRGQLRGDFGMIALAVRENIEKIDLHVTVNTLKQKRLLTSRGTLFI